VGNGVNSTNTIAYANNVSTQVFKDEFADIAKKNDATCTPSFQSFYAILIASASTCGQFNTIKPTAVRVDAKLFDTFEFFLPLQF
jgi:hypothetical protein